MVLKGSQKETTHFEGPPTLTTHLGVWFLRHPFILVREAQRKLMTRGSESIDFDMYPMFEVVSRIRFGGLNGWTIFAASSIQCMFAEELVKTHCNSQAFVFSCFPGGIQQVAGPM